MDKLMHVLEETPLAGGLFSLQSVMLSLLLAFVTQQFAGGLRQLEIQRGVELYFRLQFVEILGRMLPFIKF